MVSSTDYLEVITRPGRYVLVEIGAPQPEDHIITIKDADGSGDGQMPRAIFDELCAKGFLQQDGTEDEHHRAVFVATEDGYAAGNGSKLV
jgi:hypothetical protein